jgi:hypothetical protein
MIKLPTLILSALLAQGILPSIPLTMLHRPKVLEADLSHPLLTPTSRSITLETKTVTLPYGKKGEAYPYYKEAIIRYPIIRGLKDPAIQLSVQTAISLKRVIGKSIAEINREYEGWLSEIEYTINYNQHNILDLTYLISGMGAYPSAFEKRVTVSLQTGKILKAKDLFKVNALSAITQVVNQMMQQEIQKKVVEFRQSDPDLSPTHFAGHRFQQKNLDDFSLGNEGVTFHYDFEFPHVIKAAEPSGNYLLPYSKLIHYVRADGALSFLLSTVEGKS